MDSHYIKTEDLAQYVQKYVNCHGREYLILRLRRDLPYTPDEVRRCGEWKLISRILNVKHKYTELKVADRLLTAMECVYLIDGGHLTVYTNGEVRRAAPAVGGSPLRPSEPPPVAYPAENGRAPIPTAYHIGSTIR